MRSVWLLNVIIGAAHLARRGPCTVI